MLGGLLDGLLCAMVRPGGVGATETPSTAGDSGVADGGGVGWLIRRSIASTCRWDVFAFLSAATWGRMTSIYASLSAPDSWLRSFSTR